MKVLMATLLLVALVLNIFTVQPTVATITYPQPQPPAASGAPVPPDPSSCNTKCGGRCGKAGYMDRCMKYCMICCQDCKCVSSGTNGKKSECPCYRDKVNSKGTPKCP